MKRLLALLCATMMCVCCLGLAACGGGASAGGSASSSAASSSAPADPAEQFTGTWKIAGMEMDMGSGPITIVGDLSSFMQQLGSVTGNSSSSAAIDISLTLNADGTAVMSNGSDNLNLEWTNVTASGFTLQAPASSSSASASASAASASSASSLLAGQSTLEFTYADGVLSTTFEQDNQKGTLNFTQDGKLPNAAVISASAAQPIKAESDLVGEWKLAGMNMMGMSIYGDSAALSAMGGTSTADMTLTFEAGGKCSLSGSDATYTVDSNGAAITAEGMSAPVMALNDGIILDMSSMLGADMVMYFEK